MRGPYRLPKGKEDDEFDAENLEEWSMRCEIVFELDVKLNETVHRYGHCRCIER